MSKFKDLVNLFTKLPGVGPRQATRFVLSLLDKPKEETVEFAKAIYNLKEEIKFCKNCFNLAEFELCEICSDKKRNQNEIMVVEKITDLQAIERSGQYQGTYHVLGGTLNPPEGINPENLKISELESRINTKNEFPVELILAFSQTTYGEITSLYLEELFKKYGEKIKISRLGRGLSSGSSLEYVDEITLKNALSKRD